MSNKKNQKNKILIGAAAILICAAIIFVCWKTSESKPYGVFHIDPIVKKDRGNYATINFNRKGLQEGNVAEILHKQWTATFPTNEKIMNRGTIGIAYTDIIFRDKNGNIDNGPFDGDEIPVARLCFDIPTFMSLKKMSVKITYNGKMYTFSCAGRNNENENKSVIPGEMYIKRTSIELGQSNEEFWKSIYEDYLANGRKELYGEMNVEVSYSPSMYTYSETLDAECLISDIAEIVDDICTLSGNQSYDYLLQTEGTPYTYAEGKP